MTTHKSDAVNSGIMPDMTKPGLILCRSASYTAETATVASGDTLQMVPIPAGAQILGVDFYCSGNAKFSSDSTLNVGDGGDTDRYITGSPTFTAARVYRWPSHLRPAGRTGQGKVYTTDDTIDILFSKIESSSNVPSGVTFKVDIWYKMTGSISDEG
jgi:hypothetical protein